MPIEQGEVWNRDHVPPERFYAKSLRSRFNPNLDWLPTHNACNSSYRSDEEYFFACFSGHADTLTGRAAFDDFRRGAARGHDQGLLKTIVGQFGKVVLADGSRTFSYDGDRVERIIWKVTRGVHFGEAEQPLPETAPHRVLMLTTEPGRDPAEKYPFFRFVRDTESMGKYVGVFDFKWLCVMDDEKRMHAIAMLFWDRLIALALFHAPSCSCEECREIRGR